MALHSVMEDQQGEIINQEETAILSTIRVKRSLTGTTLALGGTSLAGGGLVGGLALGATGAAVNNIGTGAMILGGVLALKKIKLAKLIKLAKKIAGKVLFKALKKKKGKKKVVPTFASATYVEYLPDPLPETSYVTFDEEPAYVEYSAIQY